MHLLPLDRNPGIANAAEPQQRNDPRARPQPVVTRGKTSIARHTPSAQRTDCDRQVSWLPGHGVRPAFPDSGPVARSGEYSPVTVAGAAPDHGVSPLPGSLLIPVS